jgi:sulfide:quinone oxidoreductase
VLILGGGVGGIVAARRLRRRLPSRDRVVVVDRSDDHLFAPSLLWVADGSRRPAAIRRPLRRMVGAGVEIVTGEIDAVDPVTRSATVGGRRLAADALIVALGADLDPAAVPGLAEAGLNLYSLEGATALQAALRGIARGRVVVMTAAPAYKCPAAPYEAALLLEHLLRRRLHRLDVRVEVHAAEAGPMLTAGPAVAAAVRGLLEARAIPYHPGRQVVAAEPHERLLRFADGASVAYDLLTYVPPHRAPAVLRAAGLVDASGWVPVDRSSLATAYEGVYAVGDATAIPLANGRMLPKAGVFAHAQAVVVADAIIRAFGGRAPHSRFDGRGACFVETGGRRAAYGAGDFYGVPEPRVSLRPPAVWWHLAKVAFEWGWLRRLVG